MNPHTHRTARTTAIKLGLAATLATGCGLAGADEMKGSLYFPWDAHGTVYEVAAKTLMFVGQIEGTLYAETGKGVLDTALMVCPMLYEIDVEGGNARSEGRCAIYPKSGEGVVYATYSCQGQIGSCAGRLDITGGTGRFEGISGYGATISRTGTSELAITLGPGGDIADGEGLMVVSGFTYQTR